MSNEISASRRERGRKSDRTCTPVDRTVQSASRAAKTAAAPAASTASASASSADRAASSLPPRRSGIEHTLAILKVIAGVVLLMAISWEILAGDSLLSEAFLIIQLAVCAVFLCDFFVRWGTAKRHNRFFWSRLPYLLLSIPWLNIFVWTGFTPTHEWGLLLGLIPMLRAFLAMFIIVEWLVSANRMSRLFWAYIFTVLIFTYLSALLFFEYETGVNSSLHGFGNALWWAGMNVTTVGAQIFAVTGVGKVVSVLLPALGMLFFPIFTTYVLDRYTGRLRHKG